MKRPWEEELTVLDAFRKEINPFEVDDEVENGEKRKLQTGTVSRLWDFLWNLLIQVFLASSSWKRTNYDQDMDT